MRKSVKTCLRAIADLRATLAEGRKWLATELIRRASGLDTPYPNYVAVLQHLDAELGAVHRDLTAAENACDAAGPALADLRRKRDELAAALRAEVAPVWRTLRAHPGIDRGAHPGAPPESPDALTAYLARTLGFLRHLASNPPPPACGIHMDPEVLAGELEPALRELEACLKALVEAEAAITSTRTQADEAFYRARDVTSWINNLTKNLTLLAAENHMDAAARRRIRMPRRKR